MKVPARPGRGYAYVQAGDHSGGGWTNDLTALLNEAERLCPDGWVVALNNDAPAAYRWVAGWFPRRGPGYDAVIEYGATAQEAIASLVDNAYRLPKGDR